MNATEIAWPRVADEPPSLRDWRVEAQQLLVRLGLPTATDEHWRRADFGFLSALAHGALLSPEPPPPTAREALPDADLLAQMSCLVFVDGAFDARASTLPEDDALTLTPLAQVLRAAPGRHGLPHTALTGDLRWALLNHAFGADGVHLVVHRDRAPSRPIVLIHRSHAEGPGATPVSHRIHLEAGASATVIELYDMRGDAERAVLSELHLSLDAGSRLRHVRVAAPTQSAAQLDTLMLEAGADAQYVQHALWAPQRSVRSTQSLRLAGRGASAGVHAGMAVAAGAGVDLRILAVHEGDATSSEQALHVAAAQGRATVDSQAQVNAGCKAVRSRQSLRAVQVAGACDIALRPRLAIFSDDVDCRHGATTSALSTDQLFFLRSRGISEDEARRLLVAAHLQQLFPARAGDVADAWTARWLQRALQALVPAAIPAAEERPS